MKSFAVFLILSWLSFVAELAWPAALPRGSLLFPTAAAAIFWFADAGAILLAGGLMLLDWLVRPAQMPLNAVLLPPLAAAFLSASRRSDSFLRSGNLLQRIPQPLRLPALTLVLVLLQSLSDLSFSGIDSPPEVVRRLPASMLPALMRALPISAMASVLISLLDEAGLRRPWTRMAH